MHKCTASAMEKNYDYYYFLLCNWKKSRPLGQSFCVRHVVHARMRRPFELAGVNARCKSGAELLFLPTAPPAVAIMHYYYPGTPRRPPRWPPQPAQCRLCIYIFFPGRRSCWKLLLEINFVQLKHLIFTNSLIDFTAAAITLSGAYFALTGKIIKQKTKKQKMKRGRRIYTCAQMSVHI